MKQRSIASRHVPTLSGAVYMHLLLTHEYRLLPCTCTERLEEYHPADGLGLAAITFILCMGLLAAFFCLLFNNIWERPDTGWPLVDPA